MSTTIITPQTKCRVSSVLNRATREFGKQHLLDGNTDTCWNSDQGSPQWIVIDFETPVVVEEVHMMFQGGFVGSECSIHIGLPGTDGKTFEEVGPFYPDDVNTLQVFPVPPGLQGKSISHLKLLFKKSTDFYGRITVYKVDVIGRPGAKLKLREAALLDAAGDSL